MQAWQRPALSAAVLAQLAAYMEIAGGVRLVHLIVVAAQFVITLRAAAGVRLVSEFLDLSGLSASAGASYGS